jgi:hypothetical protein
MVNRAGSTPSTEIMADLPSHHFDGGDMKKDKPDQADIGDTTINPNAGNDASNSSSEGGIKNTPSDKNLPNDENATKTAIPEESKTTNEEKTKDHPDKTRDLPKRKTERERAAELFNKLVDDESEESSNEHQLRRRVRNIMYSSRLLSEERLSKAQKRMYGHVLYTSLVEDRLQYLEESLKELQKRDEPLQTETKTKISHIPAIRYLKWVEFETKPVRKEFKKNWVHAVPVSLKPHSVLEVLVEDPQIGVRRRYRAQARESMCTSDLEENEAVPKSSEPDQSIRDGPRIPMRLRIRSPLLLKILSNFSPTGELGEYDKSTMVILRPFKLLVANVEQIKQCLKDLEEKHAAMVAPTIATTDSANAKNPSNTEDAEVNTPQIPSLIEKSTSVAEGRVVEEGPVDETESYEALEHLRILVKFMDEDLKHIWDLREKCKQGSLRKIKFADLWHLFDYGQEVRTPGSQGMQL